MKTEMQRCLYSARKQAIEVPTKWQALEVASTGIRGNVISPELTDRAMLTRLTKTADRLVKGKGINSINQSTTPNPGTL
jgi:NAD(P)-dependent dehydrogenase (short-subunit alcohol dehydrogenase family)